MLQIPVMLRLDSLLAAVFNVLVRPSPIRLPVTSYSSFSFPGIKFIEFKYIRGHAGDYPSPTVSLTTVK